MFKADKLAKLMKDARDGGWALTKLNWILWWVIPFNRPHRFRIAEVGEDFITTSALYRRVNFNHIGGIHACAIATISEFATGILLLTKVDPAKYRIIMAEIKVNYHFQAKKTIKATSKLSLSEVENEITDPLKTHEKILRTMTAEVTDADNNPIATALVTWQIKSWEKVKLKV